MYICQIYSLIFKTLTLGQLFSECLTEHDVSNSVAKVVLQVHNKVHRCILMQRVRMVYQLC